MPETETKPKLIIFPIVFSIIFILVNILMVIIGGTTGYNYITQSLYRTSGVFIAISYIVFFLTFYRQSHLYGRRFVKPAAIAAAAGYVFILINALVICIPRQIYINNADFFLSLNIAFSTIGAISIVAFVIALVKEAPEKSPSEETEKMYLTAIILGFVRGLCILYALAFHFFFKDYVNLISIQLMGNLIVVSMLVFEIFFLCTFYTNHLMIVEKSMKKPLRPKRKNEAKRKSISRIYGKICRNVFIVVFLVSSTSFIIGLLGPQNILSDFVFKLILVIYSPGLTLLYVLVVIVLAVTGYLHGKHEIKFRAHYNINESLRWRRYNLSIIIINIIMTLALFIGYLYFDAIDKANTKIQNEPILTEFSSDYFNTNCINYSTYAMQREF